MPLLRVSELSSESNEQSFKLSFELESGDILGIVGPNGSRKSTLLRLLATVQQPSSGQVSLDGVCMTDRNTFLHRIGYMPDFLGLREDFSVVDTLEYFARAYEISKEQRQSAIERVLEQLDLYELRTLYTTELSAFQARRLSLARILLHEPNLLLLDEPIAGLDFKSAARFRNIIRDLDRSSMAVLISSRSIAELGQICTKMVLSDNGTFSEVLPTAELAKQLEENP